MAVQDVSRADEQRCTIGRLELVQWLNALLQLDYIQVCIATIPFAVPQAIHRASTLRFATQVSDCSDGVAFCQVRVLSRIHF